MTYSLTLERTRSVIANLALQDRKFRPQNGNFYQKHMFLLTYLPKNSTRSSIMIKAGTKLVPCTANVSHSIAE